MALAKFNLPQFCEVMDTICENGDVDTSYDFFGHKLAIPVMAGPVGAVTLHYSDKHDDLSLSLIHISPMTAPSPTRRSCSTTPCLTKTPPAIWPSARHIPRAVYKRQPLCSMAPSAPSLWC